MTGNRNDGASAKGGPTDGPGDSSARALGSGEHRAASGPAAPFPTRVGRYELCFEVAAGGMATVYLARAGGPQGFDKLVALKQIHAHLAKDAGFVEMFLDEARLASRIQHPNVCSVIDFGQADGSYYLTMEYLMGEPLGTVMRAARKAARSPITHAPRTPFDAFALRVIADAAEGLHAAHELTDEHGEALHVVHRDVSPQNLFVTFDGGVRVVDFGIAQAEKRLHKTQTGHVKGNFAYMAPEQMAGKGVDRRADVWSLGVILHELLAGRRLFKRGSLPETVEAVASGAIPPLTDFAALIDPDLVQIVDRCLQRNPEARYATTRELSRDLTHYLARQGIAVGMADVAEWLQTLCPDALAEKRELVHLARQTNAEVPHPPRLRREDPSHSTAKSVIIPGLATDPAVASQRAAAPVQSGAANATVATGGSTPSPVMGTGSATLMGSAPEPTRWPLVASATLLVLALLGVGIWASQGDSAETPSRTVRVQLQEAEGSRANVTGATRAPGVNTTGAAAPRPANGASPSAQARADGPEPQAAPAGAPPAPPITGAEEAAPQARVEPKTAHPRRDPRRNTHAERAQVKPKAHAREVPSQEEPEPEAAPAPPAAAQGPGQLSVATPGGWATVYLGTRELGSTPARFTLPSGPHRLRLVPGSGGPPIMIDVTITPGQITRITQRL